MSELITHQHTRSTLHFFDNFLLNHETYETVSNTREKVTFELSLDPIITTEAAFHRREQSVHLHFRA